MNGLFEAVITKQDKIIVGCIGAGLVVVVLLVVAFVYLPQKEQIGRLDSEIASVHDELAVAMETAAKKEELEKELKEIDKRVASFEAKLPTRKEIPKLYRKFQLAARDAGVVVKLIKKLDETKKAPRVEIPYEFEVSGSYHQLAAFINKLEMGERFVKISDVHVEEQEHGVSDTSFRLTTYLFVEGEEGAQK
jgi:Tfp pilus assembly protein PilO